MDWFAKKLLDWFDLNGRKNLPWQSDITPYRVWVSEIMLQQTQVATVIAYYERFMQHYPDVASLARASTDEVLHLWTGLGYYARGRNLHKAAKLIVDQYDGRFPEDQQQLEALPGIGPSTAGAIRAIAMQQRGVILDGNVKRVLARFHAVTGHYSQASVNKLLWQRAEDHTPIKRVDHYTQAIMDLGATLCRRSKPDCQACPVSARCLALAEDRIHELPTKKKAAPKPIRQARFFVLRLPDNRVLLEQRQQSGLWGGLWNPPERGVELSVEEFLRQHGVAQQDVIATQSGTQFRHTFSHFHLDIEPIYIDLKRQPPMLQETNQRWVAADQLNQPAVQAAIPSDEKIGLSAATMKMLKP
tara:strand:+ start:1321 stop:2394 length:1074 start_codon:yes stop_codon:yes gene_type:complete